MIDNAHRLTADDARAIAESLRYLRLVFLAQPTPALDQMGIALAVEPEMLSGWGGDSIAAEAATNGCAASMESVLRLKILTAGMPLYVRSAIQVAMTDYDSDLAPFCDALESQTLSANTAQHTILSRVFDGLDARLKQVLACVGLADVPLGAGEIVSIVGAAFSLDRQVVVRSLRLLRASGLLHAYGSQRSKVHDAMRPIALALLVDDPAAGLRARQVLLDLLNDSLRVDLDKERFPLFVRMLVDLRKVDVLADLGTEEAFHEVDDFPHVWPALEEAAQDHSLSPEARFECLDALLYYRQRNGPPETVAPLLARMEAMLSVGAVDSRSRLVYLQKSLLYWATQGNLSRVEELVKKAENLLPENATSKRVFAHSTALALWRLSLFTRAEMTLRPLIANYLTMMALDIESLMADHRPYAERMDADEEYAANCKRLADCYDLLARIFDGEGRPQGACRVVAIRLFELTASWHSVARVGIDLVYQYLESNEPKRAQKMLEGWLLVFVNTHRLTDKIVPIRYLYAHVLGRVGEIETAQKELRAVEPYFGSLPVHEQVEARRLTESLC